jgi:hypothetical protein
MARTADWQCASVCGFPIVIAFRRRFQYQVV